MNPSTETKVSFNGEECKRILCITADRHVRNMQALVFIIGSASVLLIALLVVGVNDLRVAMQNPVPSLKD